MGQLYIDGDSTISIPAINTYFTINKWNDAGTWSYAENVTLTDSTITIGATGYGYWNVSFSVSSTHSTSSSRANYTLFVNDIEITGISARRKIGNGSDYGNMGLAAGKILLYPSDVLKLKTDSDNTGTVTIRKANFNIERIN